MSSSTTTATTAAAASNGQVVNNDKTLSYVITTTAKSSTTTVTASAKKCRKSDIGVSAEANTSTNFLPIAPHHPTTFFAPNQGLTLASVQQQQLQSGSMAVFSSPTMMATLGTGPQGTVQQQTGHQAGPQLMVTASGQQMAPNGQTIFNAPNGQGLIQTAQGMGMISGLPQMQMIQAGTGHQTYTLYAGNGMFLTPSNLTMTYTQNPSQGLAIQIPNGNTNGTMITTNQLAANTPTTPVKAQNQNQMKTVTISPQQPQATKSSANNTPTSGRGQTQQNQQQQTPTLIQPTYQPNTPNQAFVIGTFQGSTPGQANGTTSTILSNTTTAVRKNATNGTNIIQKIQPATSLASPIIAPAQFKSNTSPFQTNTNATSPANGQAIMVHNGQGIQPGTGSIQLAPNHQIIQQPFQFSAMPPGLGWNQQPTQLINPNGQHIYIRNGDMLIQTSNNQFQAVPMQIAQGTQQQGTASTLHMTPTGQPLGSTINQTMPIIQTNQTVTQTTMVTQQPQPSQAPATQVTNLSTSMAGSQTNNNSIITSTPVSVNAPRQRPIRPASTQSTTSTQTSAKNKNSDMRNPAGVTPKLAPKNSPMTNAGMQVNNLPRASFGGQPVKLPINIINKANDSPNQASKSLPVSSSAATLVTLNKPATAKVSISTSTPGQFSANAMASQSSSALSVASAVGSNTQSTSTASLVNTLSTQANKGALSMPISKPNRKTDKKDSFTGIDGKSPNLPLGANKHVKNGNSINGIRTSTAKQIPSINSPANNNTLSPNVQMINGVLCHTVPSPQLKTGLQNGTVSKSIGTNVPKGLSSPKPKPKQSENVVLTHVIDGYVIQESPNPFPINGFPIANESDNSSDKNIKASGEPKENAVNKVQELYNGPAQKETKTPNGGGLKVGPINEQAKPKQMSKFSCLCCKKDIAKGRFCGHICQQNHQNQRNQERTSIPNGSTPHTTSKAAATQSISNLNSSIIIPQIPVAALPNMPPSQPAAVAPITQPLQQQLNGLKRPANAMESSVAEKKVRVNSPVTVANDATLPQSTNSVQNGVPDPKEPLVAKEASTMPELEGLWLPPGGKKPNTWKVQDVYDFIYHLEGCSEFAEEFRTQEIDGQGLMFIKEDHIINILHIKLGPALKICRKIKDLKAAFNI